MPTWPVRTDPESMRYVLCSILLADSKLADLFDTII